MDKLVTDRTSRPASPKHRLVSIEIVLADSAYAGLDRKRHRLPLPAAFSNTHKSRSIAGQSDEKQASESCYIGVPSRIGFNTVRQEQAEFSTTKFLANFTQCLFC